MRHILVLRFSALGDVALTLPVIKDVLESNPDVIITLATKQPFAFLFEGIDRLQVLPIDFAITYKGILGMYKLYKHLSFKKFDAVIDLHDVMRTQVLRTLFSFHTKVFYYKKGRGEKQTIINSKNISQLPHTIERYRAPFAKLNLKQSRKFTTPYINISAVAQDQANAFLKPIQEHVLIGLAPFAAHATKSLTQEKIIEIIELIVKQKHHKILFFAGPAEQQLVEGYIKKYPNQIINTNKLSFPAQIACMSSMNKMICVDSSNMHLAALQGIATTSIWGSTVPELGFAPIATAPHAILQIKLPCRPCSVYGKKPCTNKIKMECINQIDVQKILSYFFVLAYLIFPFH